MPVRNNFLQLLRGTGPKGSPTPAEVRIWAAADGSLWTTLSDGTAAPVAGPGALPNPTDDGDVLTVVEGEWVGAPGGGSQPLHPDDIPGLQLWLDASQIVGLGDDDPVSTWPDSSGNDFAATSGAGLEPTYKTAILNGLPVVRFDQGGGEQSMAIDGAVGVLRDTPGATAAVVANMSVGAFLDSYALWFSIGSDASTQRLSLGNDDLVVQSDDGGSPTTNAFTAGPLGTGFANFLGIADWGASGRILSITRHQSDLSIGLVASPANSSDTDSAAVAIGATETSGGGSGSFTGDIAEIIVYDRALNQAEQRQLLDYLADKYGLV